jgi:hypothetical protein
MANSFTTSLSASDTANLRKQAIVQLSHLASHSHD